MADQSFVDPTPPNPNLTTTDFDPLPIPPLDPSIFSDTFIPDFDGDVDDLDFTFDDLDLPPDTEEFLNSFPATINPPSSDPLHFADWYPNFSTVSNSGGFDQISVDQFSGDQSSDVAMFLNVSSPKSSHESGNKGTNGAGISNILSPVSETHSGEASEPVSSQGSGNFGSAVSEALNCPSPDSGTRSAASSLPLANDSANGIVDQKIKFEESNNLLLKRKKQREDVNSESRTSKYQRSNAGDKPHPPFVFNAGDDDDDKRKARLMRNRESAQLSRQRKKHYVDELEDKVRAMHSTILDLNTKISYIMAENASLRQQLGGGAMCPPPVPPPGMYPHPSMAPMGYPWMPGPYIVKPQGSQVPLVPIPRLKSRQPSPAPKAKKIESKRTEGKTKKVASVSFLGLLFFVLLFGGLVPMVNVKFGVSPDTLLGGSDYIGNRYNKQHHGIVLPVNGHTNGSDQTKGTGLSNGRLCSGNNFTSTIHCGRGLRSHSEGAESNVNKHEGSQPFPGSEGFVRPDNSSEPLVASLFVPRNDKLVKIDGNLIIHSVMASEKSMASHKDGRMKSSAATGLAVAGNMPPAIPLTGRNNGRHPPLYISSSEPKRAIGSVSGSADKDNLKSTAADGKLQQWFQEGLAGPMLSSGMCTEVFQFDVSPAPGAIVPATSVVKVSAKDRHNTTHITKGRNRRILHGTPIPLPGSLINVTKERVGRNPDKDNFGGNRSASSVVVSVLVDPRDAGEVDGDGVMGPKSLSRIFVVLLIDSVKYVTYSCMLPLKGSGAPLVTT